MKILDIGGFATSDPLTKIVQFEYDPYPVSSFISSSEENSPEDITEIKCLVPDVLVVQDGKVQLNVSVKSGCKLRSTDLAQLKYKMLAQLQNEKQITGVVICATQAKMVSLETDNDQIIIREKVYTFVNNLAEGVKVLCHDIYKRLLNT